MWSNFILKTEFNVVNPWQNSTCCKLLLHSVPKKKSVHPMLPGMATDCLGAHWCADAGLRGDPPEHHLPTDQKHAQALSGVHTGTQVPYTLLSHTTSCSDKIHASWISLWCQFFYFDFRCDFESRPQWVHDFGFHWPLLRHFVLNKLYNVHQWRFLIE